MQQDLHLAGLIISEPTTFLTNLLLAVTGIYLGSRFLSGRHAGPEFIRQYGLFLMLTGISALWGGVFSHGLKVYFAVEYSIPGWITAFVAAYYMAGGAISHLQYCNLAPFDNDIVVRRIKMVNLLILLSAIIFIFIKPHFMVVAVNAAIVLVAAGLFCEWIAYKNTGDKGSFLFLVAVTISILTILLFLFKINAEPWFNTNDLSHLVMIGCMFIFAKGFEQMKINIVSA